MTDKSAGAGAAGRDRSDGSRWTVPRRPGRHGDDERAITDLVEQPAKVMRIGSMIRQLLEEVKAAPLDEASRNRLKEIHQASIKELEAGLAPELVEELERLSLPFTEDGTPSDSELRIAQAQLVGLARGPVPRHPDRDLRPADGRARAVRADAQGAAAGCDAAARRRQPQQPGEPASGPGESGGMYL